MCSAFGSCRSKLQQQSTTRTTCFLDKCCIHQEDPVRKAEGIAQLAEVLRQSKKLVILWQPDYLSRLWCVYELAAFRHFKGDVEGCIEVLPLKVYPLLTCIYLFLTFSVSIFEFIGPYWFASRENAEWIKETIPEEYVSLYYFGAFLTFTCIVSFLLVPSAWFLFRGLVKEQMALLRNLREFDMLKTECSLPSDRGFVDGQIVQWFGSIAAFEEEVRTQVGDYVEDYFKSKALRVPWVLFVGLDLSHLCFSSLHSAHSIHLQEWETSFRYFAYAISLACFSNTIPSAICIRLAERLPFNSICSTVTGILLSAAIFPVCTSVAVLMLSPSIPIWLLMVMFLLQAALTITLFAPHAWQLLLQPLHKPSLLLHLFSTKFGKFSKFAWQKSGRLPESESAPPCLEGGGSVTEHHFERKGDVEGRCESPKKQDMSYDPWKLPTDCLDCSGNSVVAAVTIYDDCSDLSSEFN